MKNNKQTPLQNVINPFPPLYDILQKCDEILINNTGNFTHCAKLIQEKLCQHGIDFKQITNRTKILPFGVDEIEGKRRLSGGFFFVYKIATITLIILCGELLAYNKQKTELRTVMNDLQSDTLSIIDARIINDDYKKISNRCHFTIEAIKFLLEKITINYNNLVRLNISTIDTGELSPITDCGLEYTIKIYASIDISQIVPDEPLIDFVM